MIHYFRFDSHHEYEKFETYFASASSVQNFGPILKQVSSVQLPTGSVPVMFPIYGWHVDAEFEQLPDALKPFEVHPKTPTTEGRVINDVV